MISDAWLALLQAYQPGVAGWVEALRAHGSADALIDSSSARLGAFDVPPDAAGRVRAPDQQLLSKWRGWLDGPDRQLVTYGSAQYPAQLAESNAPPLAVWVRGADLRLLKAPQLAVVGSRNPTANGRELAADFARELSRAGLAITSGMACGIDAAAHEGALAGGGGTIAVLGCGIDIVYPKLNRTLADAIAVNGLLVSEYPPGTPVRAFQFPQRNRIIAALSLGTLVVEATRRSGSLITARLAGDYGRDVFAVPGSVHNPLARGCHLLLRQGAKLVEEIGDILSELAASICLDGALEAAPPPAESPASTRDPAYANLLKCLGFDGVRINDLVARTGLTPAELSSMLLVLELEGQVEALPGGRYALLAKRS
jgi:DNA processing protein